MTGGSASLVLGDSLSFTPHCPRLAVSFSPSLGLPVSVCSGGPTFLEGPAEMCSCAPGAHSQASLPRRPSPGTILQPRGRWEKAQTQA